MPFSLLFFFFFHLSILLIYIYPLVHLVHPAGTYIPCILLVHPARSVHFARSYQLVHLYLQTLARTSLFTIRSLVLYSQTLVYLFPQNAHSYISIHKTLARTSLSTKRLLNRIWEILFLVTMPKTRAKTAVEKSPTPPPSSKKPGVSSSPKRRVRKPVSKPLIEDGDDNDVPDESREKESEPEDGFEDSQTEPEKLLKKLKTSGKLTARVNPDVFFKKPE
jgi:hypothetical protein